MKKYTSVVKARSKRKKEHVNAKEPSNGRKNTGERPHTPIPYKAPPHEKPTQTRQGI